MSYPHPHTGPSANLLQYPRQAGNTLTSNRAGILAGVLLLATFLLPVGSDHGRLVWTVQLLPRAPGWVPVVLPTLWVMGLAAIIVGSTLRAMTLSVCYLVLATTVVIFAVALAVQLGAHGIFGESSADAVLALLGVLALGAFLVVTGVRLRLPTNNPVCVAQIIISIFFVGLMISFFVQMVVYVANMPRDAPGAMWLMGYGGLLMQLLLALAGVPSVVNGFEFQSQDTSLTRTGRRLAISVLLTVLTFCLLLPVMMDAPAGTVLRMLRAGTVLRMLHVVLLTLGLAILVVEAFVSFISEVGNVLLRRAGVLGGASPGQPRMRLLSPMRDPSVDTHLPGPRVTSPEAGSPTSPHRADPPTGAPEAGPPRTPLNQ